MSDETSEQGTTTEQQTTEAATGTTTEVSSERTTGSILGGGSATSDGTATAGGFKPAEVPEWKQQLPEELRNDPSLSHIKDIPSLVNSYLNAQKMVGSNKIVLPGEHSGEEAWNDVFNKLGRPATADKYEIKTEHPEVFQEEMLGKFKQAAHSAGLSQKQLQGILDWYGNETTSAIEAQQKQMEYAANQELEKIRSEWGPGYERNLLSAQTAVSEVGKVVPGLGEWLDNAIVDGVPAGNHPMMLKLFKEFGKNFLEDQITGKAKQINGFSSMTVEEIDKKIAEIESNPAYFDNNNPQRQHLAREALKLREMKFAATKSA